MSRYAYLVLSLFCVATTGCAYFRDRCDADRLSRGRVLVLSGIETPSVFTSNIANGIVESGWNGSVEIHDWTTGHFHNFAWHLMDLETNRQRAQELSDKIVTYQDQYPDAPVHLIGHSGGAGIIVMALEALPSERQVTTATLLASALSPDHDLSIALARTTRGIWHYHSPGDFVLCGLGTSLLGTIDREHRPAAAMLGFNRPLHLTDFERHQYDTKLHDVPYNLGMLRDGNIGEHFGCSQSRFVRKRIAPVILATTN